MTFNRVLSLFVLAFLTCAPVAHAQEADVAPAAAVETDHNAEASAEHAEGGSAMPQLDSTYYASQLFWLAITGVLLYMLMSKVALPGVSRIVEMRDSQVRSDLEQAYKLKQQAEDLKISYRKALRDADERAKTLIDKTTRDLRDKQSHALADAVERVNKKISEAEHYLRGEKDALINEAPIISERLAKVVTQELSKGRA